MTCYFLKIPIEMRLRIYQFLLPDRPVPARYEKSSLASDGGGVHMPILCVNRQIHDEAARFLYRTRGFSIELFEDWLSMCNSSQHFALNRPSRNPHSFLQDYQLRRMLLGQRILEEPSRSAHTPTVRGYVSRTEYPIFDANVPLNPVWDLPLSEKYFNMIQFFRVEILLPYPSAWWLPNSDPASQQATMSKLLDYCDHLHRLIARLRTMQRPIARLEIVIRIYGAQVNLRSAFPLAQVLMGPFRRLRDVAKQSLSITTQNSEGEIELLTPDWAASPTGGKFSAYLTQLFECMASSQAPPELPVFKAYWQLQKLFTYMKEHYRHGDPKIEKIARLLYNARLAREDENLTLFKNVWDDVVDIWFNCLSQQVEFQSDVMLSIDAIDDIVLNGSQGKLPQ